MDITGFLAAEWKPALGCTEPAAVAWTAALAADQAGGNARQVRLRCDARTYKNCYAVGIPNSGRQSGLLWSLALGAHLGDPSLGLRSFEGNTPASIAAAGELLARRGAEVEVESDRVSLMVDVTVVSDRGVGRAVVEREHTNLARLEKDGRLVGGAASRSDSVPSSTAGEEAARMRIGELMELARTLGESDRVRLREGLSLNLAIARHGLSLLPAGFVPPGGQDSQTRISRLVSAGVYARMSGEPLTVMTLAGSGNKGITTSIPVVLWGRESGHDEGRIEEALAFACLMTTTATWHLGTLSAICGAANASGIGIAAALVMLEGGSAHQVGLAVSNMVGNVAGMICDGAKIGCAMKTMTGVDAAFRAANLALAGIGIPATDGIVGEDGEESLSNLGRLAQHGMVGVDAEILRIMQDKLRR
ncbi:MAG: serine dehydratase subunit alpha family protein [Acidobacteria bacterium]|nr:serine dehydratase subunit alpha family protein [Acidobacteriota bacterium]